MVAMNLPFVFRGIVLPEHLRESLIEYVFSGRPTGGFLEACIDNDLHQAVNRADPESLNVIPAVLGYLYLDCPAGCWGFKGAAQRWIEKKRKERDAEHNRHIIAATEPE